MFKFIGICVLLSAADAIRRGFSHPRASTAHFASRPAPGFHNGARAEVLSEVRPDGFNYHLETPNGISAVASGDDNGRIAGAFQWISPEGEHISLSYIADENGYRPQSDLLPTPPPIPEAILKSLEYNEKHPYEEESDEHHLHHQHHQHPPHHQHHQHHRLQYHYNRRF